MSAVELTRIKARIEALETSMANMVMVTERIEQMYNTVKQEHEEMMQKKADSMRAGTLAEIEANMSVLRRELMQELKNALRAAQ